MSATAGAEYGLAVDVYGDGDLDIVSAGILRNDGRNRFVRDPQRFSSGLAVAGDIDGPATAVVLPAALIPWNAPVPKATIAGILPNLPGLRGLPLWSQAQLRLPRFDPGQAEVEPRPTARQGAAPGP